MVESGYGKPPTSFFWFLFHNLPTKQEKLVILLLEKNPKTMMSLHEGTKNYCDPIFAVTIVIKGKQRSNLM